MNRFRMILLVGITVLFPLRLLSQGNLNEPLTGTQGNRSKFRVIRSISGSKGIQLGNRYIIEDPRSVFYVPSDRQVIVYFEYEGPVGPHHVEGLWKYPDGKVGTISDFDYVSRDKEFGIYWTLALAETAPPGTWVLEGHIDGEWTGKHTFQIISGNRPTDATPSKRMLSPSEIYHLAAASTVSIEKIGANDEVLSVGSGFVAEAGMVLTAFQAIDSATRLRLTFSDGRKLETDKVSAWNRHQDWAAIKVDVGTIPALQTANANSWNVGDLASYPEVAREGNRVISEAKIVGQNSFHLAGARLNLSGPVSDKAVGAPLINQYGEVIGITGGSLIPGASQAISQDIMAPPTASGSNTEVRGGMAIPISLINMHSIPSSPTTLESLITNGESLPPLTAQKNVGYGRLTHRLDKGWPTDATNNFSRRDAKMTVFVLWDPAEKAKGSASMVIYDINNQLLVPAEQVKRIKVNLRPGLRVMTYWDCRVSDLPDGLYRVDVSFNDAPVWRTFFRIAD